MNKRFAHEVITEKIKNLAEELNRTGVEDMADANPPDKEIKNMGENIKKSILTLKLFFAIEILGEMIVPDEYLEKVAEAINKIKTDYPSEEAKIILSDQVILKSLSS